jgi:SAM-dependent methyltransferase
LLEHIFGWRFSSLEKRNVTPNQSEIIFTEEDLDLIRQYNKLDILLYEFVKKRFENALKQMRREKESANYKKEPPILLEPIKQSDPGTITQKDDFCVVCKTKVQFSGKLMVCSNCKSTVSSRAAKTYLDNKFPGWQKNLVIHEYNPYLKQSLHPKIKKYTTSFYFPGEKIGAKINGVVNQNSKNLKFKNSSFDVFICLDTLDCLLDPEKSIQEMVRVLKDNGILIVSIPQKRFMKDSRAKRWRASEIAEKYQPLYPAKYRESALNTKMLIALEFSKNVEEIISRWVKQPVQLVDVLQLSHGGGEETIMVLAIQKKHNNKVAQYEHMRLDDLERLLNRDDLSLPVRLDIYHEFVTIQKSVINKLEAELVNIKIKNKK